jgi:threonine/homoserine/homoserine lactone efflux protein
MPATPLLLTFLTASGTVGQWLHRWPRLLVWQTRFTGLIMVGLGLRLLLANDAAPLRSRC